MPFSFAKKNFVFFLSSFLVLTYSFSLFAQNSQEKYSSVLLNENPIFPPLRSLPFFSTQRWNNQGKERDKEKVTAIVIHETREYGQHKYIRKLLKNDYMVHFLVDKKGNIHGTLFPFYVALRANPAVDAVAIHITVEGAGKDVIKNKRQMQALIELVHYLKEEGNIAANNYDVASKKGIFSYKQVMKKYGSFVKLGDSQVEKILQTLLPLFSDGRYYSEYEWKDRFRDDWILRRENPASLKKRKPLNRGRDFTPLPSASLDCVQQTNDKKLIQEKRLNYPFRGKIHPTCAVLHYTASDSFEISHQILEKRHLSSQILVNTDGKIYQIMDFLDDRAAAAYGTNNHCLQIEIVGKNTQTLLQNKTQAQQVVILVQELTRKYNFPLDNYDIQSLRGVFSHTQAKKLWGKSVYLDGDDYDPGEPYMQKILEAAGGRYYSEEDWRDRKGKQWMILYGDFQP